MPRREHRGLSRRSFLRLGAGAAAAPLLPFSLRPAFAADAVREYLLAAGESPVSLAGQLFPPTMAWCFNGRTPGTELRIRHGETLRIKVRNDLPENMTVHWHGLRIPNAMDGVPFLTQPPIERGEEFVYEFQPPDAGTFWYHAHQNSPMQQGMGLHGPLIVEERDPPKVDRDLVWVLDDWRLDQQSQIVQDWDNVRDFSRGGRIGNTVTLNGKIGGSVEARAGERVRLRLINSANGRIFSLRFQGHKPTVIALDGQPVKPYEPAGGAITLAPAQRADVIIDMQGTPGENYSVFDSFYPQSPFELVKIAYSSEAPVREQPLASPIRLADHRIPKPDLSDPVFKDVPLEGGDLGRLRGAYLEGRKQGLSDLLLVGKMWAICGISGFRPVMPPLVTAEQGRTVVLLMRNRSVWPHTMHIHGHHFTVLEHTGRPEESGQVRDTVWLGPEEETRIAFVADNRGDWLFHCHMLSHLAAGMTATLRVV